MTICVSDGNAGPNMNSFLLMLESVKEIQTEFKVSISNIFSTAMYKMTV